MGKKGKKYPAHRIARKKILDDQNSPTPPPQELNGRPLIVFGTGKWPIEKANTRQTKDLER